MLAIMGGMSDAEEYRAKADECREEAEKAIREADKARWLRIAEQWLKLAQHAEKKRPWKPSSCQLLARRRRMLGVLAEFETNLLVGQYVHRRQAGRSHEFR